MLQRCKHCHKLTILSIRSFVSTTPIVLSTVPKVLPNGSSHNVNSTVAISQILTEGTLKNQHQQTTDFQSKYVLSLSAKKQQIEKGQISSFSQVQHGVASITAESFRDSTAVAKTYLTSISHKAPARVIPLLSSPVASAGAAVAVLSCYGGGLLPGDEVQYNISCRSDAKVAITTQGSNRIYKQPQIMTDDNNAGSVVLEKPSRSVVNVTIEKTGTVIVAPDPVSVFTDSVYQQNQRIEFDHSSSFCIIDWISSGRYLSGERWQQRSLQATTSVYCRDRKNDASIPVLADSIAMRRGVTDAPSHDTSHSWGMDCWSSNSTTISQPWNAFASMLVYGDQMQNIIHICQQVQLALIEPYARVREMECYSSNSSKSNKTEFSVLDHETSLLPSLSGRVTMGISEIPLDCGTQHSKSSLFAIRFAAMSNEDLYRIFHKCLLPLKGLVGVELYKDRIRASSCHNIVSTTATKASKNENPYDIQTRIVVGSTSNFDLAKERNKTRYPWVDSRQSKVVKPITHQTSLDKNYWTANMLADSSLPTGSFAHSAGLEAINQLGIISTPEDISLFVQIATKSTLQQATPFIQQTHLLLSRLLGKQLGKSPEIQKHQIEQFCSLWSILDQHAHARLVSNNPACRASLDQGGSLFRVASQLLLSHEIHHKDMRFDWQLTSALLQNISAEIQKSSTYQSVGHMSTVLGIITGILGMDEKSCCRLLGYCVARDIVSAAVRMNLLGPLASVGVLVNAQQAAEEGYGLSLTTIDESGAWTSTASNKFNSDVDDFEATKYLMLDQIKKASSCSPLFDSIQPCHDVLSSRMFRS
jgi:urease accessory protein UreH/urease accessory protein UreF